MKKKHWKHTLAFLLGTVLLWSTAIPAAAAWTQEAFDATKGNVIKNGGFENGTANWLLTGDVAVDKAAAYTGASGMLFKGPYTPKIEQEVTLKGKTEYVLNVLAKGTRKLPSTLSFSFVAGNKKQRLSMQKTKTGWHRYSYVLSFPEDTAGTLLLSAGGSTDVYIDDVCLAPSSALTPSIPMDTNKNMVLNSGFEAGLSGWKALIHDNEDQDPDSLTTISQSNESHSGSHSLCVSKRIGFPKAVAQLSPDMPAGEYEVTAYVKGNGSGTIDFTFRNTDILHNYEIATVYYSQPILDSNWQKVSFTIHLNPDAPAYFLGVSSTANEYLVDDVRIVPTGYTLPHSGQEPEPQPNNLLQNPDFENGLTGWTQQGLPNAFSTDGQAYSGTHSAYFGYFTGEPLQNYVEQSVAAGAGRYTFSAMVKPDDTLQGVGCMLMLEALDKNGTVLASVSSPAVYDASKGWQKTGATLAAPAGTASLRLKIGGIYCTGAFYVDYAALLKA